VKKLNNVSLGMNNVMGIGMAVTIMVLAASPTLGDLSNCTGTQILNTTDNTTIIQFTCTQTNYSDFISQFQNTTQLLQNLSNFQFLYQQEVNKSNNLQAQLDMLSNSSNLLTQCQYDRSFLSNNTQFLTNQLTEERNKRIEAEQNKLVYVIGGVLLGYGLCLYGIKSKGAEKKMSEREGEILRRTGG